MGCPQAVAGERHVSPGEILDAAAHGSKFGFGQFTLACCSGVDCGGLAHRHLHLRNMRIESVRGETQPRVRVLGGYIWSQLGVLVLIKPPLTFSSSSSRNSRTVSLLML